MTQKVLLLLGLGVLALFAIYFLASERGTLENGEPSDPEAQVEQDQNSLPEENEGSDSMTNPAEETPPAESSENESEPIGQTATLEGEIVCLPHKDTSGPITLECAFGLLTQGGVHYGLRDLDQSAIISGELTTGVQVRVAGTLMSPEPTNKYDIEAVVDVTSVTVL
jgi:hypothetical protein